MVLYMFVIPYVCQSFCPQEVSHIPFTHNALDLTIQGPHQLWSQPPWTWALTVQGPPPGPSALPDMGHHCAGTPALAPTRDILWLRLETCSNLLT